MLRVCVIGPVPPWRGGISDHTAYLSSALGEFSDVYIHSFSRQYPKFLYPGQSQRSSNRAVANVKEIKFSIDSLNPASWIKCVFSIKKSRADLIILPWWSNYWFLQTLFFLLTLRGLGKSTALICHNSLPHENAQLSKIFFKIIFSLPNFVYVHSLAEKRQISELGRTKNIEVNLHPPYKHFPENFPRLPKRAKLELLFFGFIREYKGLDLLIDALANLPRHFFLTVAGECWIDQNKIIEQIKKYELEENVELIFQFVDDETSSALFNRTDIVCLPYRSSTGSGIIPTAYSFGKPVIASTAGSNAEMVQDESSGWLFEPEDLQKLESIIERLIAHGLPEMTSGVQEMLGKLSWESYARRILKNVNIDFALPKNDNTSF